MHSNFVAWVSANLTSPFTAAIYRKYFCHVCFFTSGFSVLVHILFFPRFLSAGKLLNYDVELMEKHHHRSALLGEAVTCSKDHDSTRWLIYSLIVSVVRIPSSIYWVLSKQLRCFISSYPAVRIPLPPIFEPIFARQSTFTHGNMAYVDHHVCCAR